MIDEYTDVEPAHIVKDMSAIVMDALENPSKPRPEGETMLGEITRRSVQPSCAENHHYV